MTIKIPKVFVQIPLGDYTDQFGSQVVEVWVNPPRALLKQRLESIGKWLKTIVDQNPQEIPTAETMTRSTQDQYRELFAWYAEIWSQGEHGEHWTADDVWQAYEQSPNFVMWLLDRTNKIFEERQIKPVDKAGG